MTVKAYLDNIKMMQKAILDYIEDEPNSEPNFLSLTNIFRNMKISSNKNDLKLLFRLIVKISNNHYRPTTFFAHIEKILEIFQNEIKKYFTNYQIFQLFKSNKRLLLYLIEAKLLIINSDIAQIMLTDKYLQAKYPQYFYKELKPFFTPEQSNQFLAEIRDPAKYELNRKIGENDNLICELIRLDKANEFTTQLSIYKMPLESLIPTSIYETNSLLIKKTPTLIEYTAFFGSIEVFRYLATNIPAVRSPTWIFGIHSPNTNMVKLLEFNKIPPEDLTYKECIRESIKCHHNEIINFFLKDYFKKDPASLLFLFSQCLRYYNFSHILVDNIKKSHFYLLCKYDYIAFVDILLNTMGVEVNHTTVSKNNYLIQF